VKLAPTESRAPVLSGCGGVTDHYCSAAKRVERTVATPPGEAMDAERRSSDPERKSSYGQV
jgi:hypothetical protein